jgi:hypothetical protein
MFTTSHLTRTAAIAAMIASLGASTAVARQSDLPLRPGQATTTAVPETQQWTQPRVDAMGVRPTGPRVAPAPNADVAPAAPAVPLTQVDDTGGMNWLLAGIIGSSALALLLIVMVAFTDRTLAHPFRARHV